LLPSIANELSYATVPGLDGLAISRHGARPSPHRRSLTSGARGNARLPRFGAEASASHHYSVLLARRVVIARWIDAFPPGERRSAPPP